MMQIFLFTLGLLALSLGIAYFIYEYLYGSLDSLNSNNSNYADSHTLADISQEIMGFPSSIIVKNRFSRLKYLSRGEIFLEEVLLAEEQSYQELIERIETRFDLIDEKLFQVKSLLTKEVFKNFDKKLKDLMTCHHKKFTILINRVEKLIQTKRKQKFIALFLELNEEILTYQEQIQDQLLAIAKIINKDSQPNMTSSDVLSLATLMK